MWKCVSINYKENCWGCIQLILTATIRLSLVSREIGYIHAVVTVGYHLRKCSYFQTKEAFIKNKSPIKRQLEVRR